MDNHQTIKQRLRDAGLRLTRQRTALAALLFTEKDRHVTAEAFFDEARSHGIKVSQATIYNTLHQFTTAGLLRKIVIDSERAYFDTNCKNHHHFFTEEDGHLIDIPDEELGVTPLPELPEGREIERIDVIIRLK